MSSVQITSTNCQTLKGDHQIYQKLIQQLQDKFVQEACKDSFSKDRNIQAYIISALDHCHSKETRERCIQRLETTLTVFIEDCQQSSISLKCKIQDRPRVCLKNVLWISIAILSTTQASLLGIVLTCGWAALVAYVAIENHKTDQRCIENIAEKQQRVKDFFNTLKDLKDSAETKQFYLLSNNEA